MKNENICEGLKMKKNSLRQNKLKSQATTIIRISFPVKKKNKIRISFQGSTVKMMIIYIFEVE